MANRFSFDAHDEASLNPRYNSDTSPYQSARGNTGYQVSSALPDPYRAPSPPEHPASLLPGSGRHIQPAAATAPLNDYDDYGTSRQANLQGHSMANPFSDSRGTSPARQGILAVPPPPQSYRDPHAMDHPIPPPHRRQNSSQDDTAYYGAGAMPTYQDDPTPYDHSYPDYPSQSYDRGRSPEPHPRTSHLAPPGAAAGAGLGVAAGAAAGALGSSVNHRLSARPSPERYSSRGLGAWNNDSWADLGSIDPHEIADEDDDGNPFADRHGARGAAAGAAGGAVAGGILMKSRDASGQYGQVPGGSNNDPEKSNWLKDQTTGHKRLKWMVGLLIGLIIVLAIVGGVVGGVITSQKSSSAGPGGSAADDDDGKHLTKDSSEIKALMNNKNLHKVFPGMDYTPLGAQYPDCLTKPVSQNNVTKDVAVLSQLSHDIRLYGTDCNQTSMVLQAMTDLDVNQNMKLWMGVYLNGNDTTNKRQLDQLYSTLDDPGTDRSVIAGVIVGNELLYEQTFPLDKLTQTMNDVKSELKKRSINVPVATSDLGDNWTKAKSMVQVSDIIMSNIHPFFAGQPVDQAASWTYSFWSNNDLGLTANDPSKKQIISEVGWPSVGGNDCGIDPNSNKNVKCKSPTEGSVAGIDEMNKFMADFVCEANKNGTGYFWFEAFDEPWKVQFDDPSTGLPPVEDHWGLMDVNRNLKPGVIIPDCGGVEAKGANG